MSPLPRPGHGPCLHTGVDRLRVQACLLIASCLMLLLVPAAAVGLACNTRATGTLDPIGNPFDDYPLDGGAANETVKIVVGDLSDAMDEQWTLLVDGSPVFTCTALACDRTLPAGSSYVIRVFDANGVGGDYSLSWQGLSDGITCGAQIDCDETVEGTLEDGGDTDSFTIHFAGSESESVLIAMSQHSDADEGWQIYRPNGTLVTTCLPGGCSAPLAAAAPSTTDVYTIVTFDAFADVGSSSSYNLEWQGVSEGLTCGSPLSCGRTANGAHLGADLGAHTFAFDGAQNQEINIAVSQDPPAGWNLYRPDGVRQLTCLGGCNTTLSAAFTGVYTIISFDDGIDSTTPAPYNLTWQGLSEGVACGRPMMLSGAARSVGSGHVDRADTDTHRFWGCGGKSAVLTIESTGGAAVPLASLFDPAGNALFNSCGSSCSAGLPGLATDQGIYTVEVFDAGLDEMGDYDLSIAGVGLTCNLVSEPPIPALPPWSILLLLLLLPGVALLWRAHLAPGP